MRRAVPIAALLLAGCTVGPDYHPQDMATPSAYSELPVTQNQAPLSTPVAGETDISQWWLQFGDAELQKLIGRALQSNLDLLAAASRVREAREREIIAGAAGLPQFNANGVAAGLHSGGAPKNASLVAVGFDATWEADLFGGARRNVEAAQAGTEAALWQMRDGEVALTAEIATDYLTLRATQERIAILRAEAKAQQDLLQMMKARAGAGFVTELDVNQQSSLADSTAAQIPELEGSVHALEHAIAVLLADEPNAMAGELDTKGALPRMPSSLPVGLPSDLLRRRPDIRRAERELAASSARIGVAVSDLYPKFDLIGAVGFLAGSPSNLVARGSSGEFGLGSITWPIFHWGQNQANVRAKEEEAKQAYYAYQKTVLGAVQNVEDALSRYTTEQQRLVTLERAEATAQSSTKIAMQQFRVGTVTYVNVLVAEATELTVRDQLVQSRQVFGTDLISLYKALGGGWVAEPTNAAAASGADDTSHVMSGPLLHSVAVRQPAPGPESGPDVAHAARSSSNATAPDPVAGALKTADTSPHAPPPTHDHITPDQSKSLAGAKDVPTNLRSRVVDDAAPSGTQLQLGAWRSEDAAMEGWRRAARLASELLKGLSPHIVPADLPGKGRYYRLRIAPASRANSVKLCEALTAKGLACILTRD